VKDQEKKTGAPVDREPGGAIRSAENIATSTRENVKAMIAAKLKGQQVTEVTQPHLAPVIDLMEALKKSLADKQAP